MTENTPQNPVFVEAMMPAINELAEMTQRLIDAAIAPLEARIAELESKVAELAAKQDTGEGADTG